MGFNFSQRQLNNYFVNFVLLAVVVLSWVYAILAGKFISQRHLKMLDLPLGSEKLSYDDSASSEPSNDDNTDQEYEV